MQSKQASFVISSLSSSLFHTHNRPRISRIPRRTSNPVKSRCRCQTATPVDSVGGPVRACSHRLSLQSSLQVLRLVKSTPAASPSSLILGERTRPTKPRNRVPEPGGSCSKPTRLAIVPLSPLAGARLTMHFLQVLYCPRRLVAPRPLMSPRDHCWLSWEYYCCLGCPLSAPGSY